MCDICFIGHLASVDNYMNLQLKNSEEWVDGALAGQLGEILIRCNNVLYIRPGRAASESQPETAEPSESDKVQT